MNIITYTAKPQLPEPLKPLEELAHNLWFSWNYEAVNLFIRLDSDVWTASGQNPVRTLSMVPQETFDQFAADDSYVAAVQSVYERFKRYKNGETWYTGSTEDTIAYLSMEYGLDVSLPIYSGGLGVLSGDHLITSSDLGLPLVGVGLLYRQGYFQQYLNADGFQQESYPENDWYNMPVERCTDDNGDDVKITVQMADAQVVARIWVARIGRNSLYLLDTNIDENTEEFRRVTATLYGGNRETRIRQEILLGIGGIRALRALGINPAVTHMNEGHSAFLAIERIREHMLQNKLSFEEAVQAVWPTNIFTTHTPVPAGNERFSVELMEKYFPSIAEGLGLSFNEFMALGREYPTDQLEHFCMTVLALRLSSYNNAVSELHGHVSREMWHGIWKELPLNEVPITHVTNGVHTRTWLSHDMVDLLDRYFGPRFYDEPTDLTIWRRMDRISDEELWRTHERRKARLVQFARSRLEKQLRARGATGSTLVQAREVLSPSTLTIAFARRFATYKRASLLFRDTERLVKLLTDNDRPIQIIFSGKAHPHDIPGKNLIKEIVHFASRPEIRSRIVFLENYDMNIAQYLVAGADLWLNTPRRPLEASGTSGMKAAINGALNCSVLDGWWAEAYNPGIGWAIGNGEEYEDEELQDEIEIKALYNLLEHEIIPTFYDRGLDGLPRSWIGMMKDAMQQVAEQFSSARMLTEYAERFYMPALENSKTISKNDYKLARELAEQMHHLRAEWDRVEVAEIESKHPRQMHVGETLKVEAKIHLGELAPEEVRVELYHGRIDSQGNIERPDRKEMRVIGKAEQNGVRRYAVEAECRRAGRQGYAVRVLPKHDALVHDFVPGLVRWS